MNEKLSFENFEDKAYQMLDEFRSISPALLMRRFQINFDSANRICMNVWKRQHLEARELAKEIDRNM